MNLRRAFAALAILLSFPAFAATKTWNGSASANWNLNANWDEGAVPVAGDDLVFKTGAANLTNTNNLASGLVFGSVTFQQGGYTLQGSSFGLSSGINGLNATGSNTIQQAITFSGNQTIKVVSGGTLTLNGNITLGASTTLAFQADGAVTMGGVVSGTGGLSFSGLGTLTLSGNNTYSGATSISQGTVIASSSTALGSSGTGTTVVSGGTLQLQGNITCAEPITLNGNGVGGAGALLSASGANTVSGPVTLNAPSPNYVGVTAGTLTISGVISSTPAVTTPLTKVGAGTLVLTNANTYSGTTTVLVGALNVQNANALGDLANTTVVAFNAALEIQGGITLAEPLALNGLGITSQGALRSVSGGNVVTGAVTLESDAAIGADSGSTVIVQGNVDGTGYLRKAGAGTLILSGNNTYTGQTRVNAGIVRAQSATALGDPTTGTIVTTGAQLELQGNITIPSEPLDLSGSGVSAGGALRNVTGANTWGGPITLSSPASVNVANGSLNITGAIGGTGSLSKVGANTLTLSGTNTYSGGTGVSQGTLLVNGTLDAATNVGVASGATLGGSGTVGGVGITTSGFLSPGQSPGILSTGNVGFSSGSTFTVEIGGSAPGTGYDQLKVNGTIDLGGATLNASLVNGFVPLPNTTYTIIDNDGAEPVTGTFNGFAEGSTISVGGVFAYFFKITYAGGDGNDVVLTRISGNRQWSGTLGNSWTTSCNWGVFCAPPVPGDNLIFPAGAMNTNNVNDFPPGFVVNSITISGSGYVLNTNQMELLGGVSVTSGNNTINGNGSTLSQSQTFSVANGSTLNLQGTWTANGLDWTFDLAGGAGSTGNLGGSFNLVKNGTGTLSITSNNSYTGTTLINSGLVFVQATDAFGTGASPVTVANGGAIQVNGVSPTKTLVLNGSGVGGAGALRGSSFGGGWAGNIVLNTPVTIGSNTSSFLISGVVSGSGDLTTTTSGPIFLTNANTFTGSVTIQSGPLQISNGAALGDTTNGTSIVSGELEIAGGINVGAEPLTFAMGGSSPTVRNTSGSNTWAGNVTLQTTGIFTADPGTDLAINGTISGAFGVSKNLAGTIAFGGANTYTGTTTVNAGTLRVTNGGALGTAAGQTAVLSGAALQVDGGGTGITAGNELIVLNGTGGGAGALQSVNGSNVLNGTVTLVTSDAAIGVGSGSTLTLAGLAQGAGGLTKVGLGTLSLLSNNNYSLGTTVNAGKLIVNGMQTQTAAVNAGGTLGGSGAVGAATSTGGTISPGQSPGILSTGNLTLNSSSTFNVELNGSTPGSGYDRVAATGSVTLGNAALSVAVGFTPTPGDTFTIIQNDGTLDPVSGTFSGLANGAMFVPAGSYQFQIFYNGGDGNDVVLSYVGCVTDFSGPTVTPPASTTVTQTICM